MIIQIATELIFATFNSFK